LHAMQPNAAKESGRAKPDASPDIQARSDRSIFIVGAGDERVNGKYSRSSERIGHRPVYKHDVNPRLKIQWSTQSEVWMLDDITGFAPYKIGGGRSDSTFPYDGAWELYQNGKLPVPQTSTSQESPLPSLYSVPLPSPSRSPERYFAVPHRSPSPERLYSMPQRSHSPTASSRLSPASSLIPPSVNFGSLKVSRSTSMLPHAASTLPHTALTLQHAAPTASARSHLNPHSHPVHQEPGVTGARSPQIPHSYPTYQDQGGWQQLSAGNAIHRQQSTGGIPVAGTHQRRM